MVGLLVRAAEVFQRGPCVCPTDHGNALDRLQQQVFSLTELAERDGSGLVSHEGLAKGAPWMTGAVGIDGVPKCSVLPSSELGKCTVFPSEGARTNLTSNW